MQNPKNPLHDAVKEEKGCRLARGKLWMGQAEQSIQHACGLAELKQVRDWEKRPVQALQQDSAVREPSWPAGKANAKVQMLVEANSKPHDIVNYTDGSVTRDQSGWGFTVKQVGRTARGQWCQQSQLPVWPWRQKQSHMQYCDYPPNVTHTSHLPSFSQTQWTSCKRWSLEWAALTGTQPCTVFGYKDFCRSAVLGTLESVGMNGQIDRQAQQMSHLVCSLAGQRCSEAWGTFWTWTVLSITALIAWMKEKWRKEAADIPPSKVRNDLCSTRQIIGTVSRATVGRLLRDGAERIWAFPSTTMPFWTETVYKSSICMCACTNTHICHNCQQKLKHCMKASYKELVNMKAEVSLLNWKAKSFWFYVICN